MLKKVFEAIKNNPGTTGAIIGATVLPVNNVYHEYYYIKRKIEQDPNWTPPEDEGSIFGRIVANGAAGALIGSIACDAPFISLFLIGGLVTAIHIDHKLIEFKHLKKLSLSHSSEPNKIVPEKA